MGREVWHGEGGVAWGGRCGMGRELWMGREVWYGEGGVVCIGVGSWITLGGPSTWLGLFCDKKKGRNY